MSVHNLAFQTGQGLRYNGKELLPRRINNQNLVYRLFHRQIHTPSPGTHFHQVRSLYTNVFPNYTVVNVEKPPCFLRKFSPDGKYFIAFSSDQTSLEMYTFQVIKWRCYENYRFMFFFNLRFQENRRLCLRQSVEVKLFVIFFKTKTRQTFKHVVNLYCEKRQWKVYFP